jgi:hypothetical protein
MRVPAACRTPPARRRTADRHCRQRCRDEGCGRNKDKSDRPHRVHPLTVRCMCFGCAFAASDEVDRHRLREDELTEVIPLAAKHVLPGTEPAGEVR